VRIKGELDAKQLRRAVVEVVRRHEILRTTYEYLPGMSLPVQVVNDAEEAAGFIVWQAHDLSNEAEQAQQRKLDALAKSSGK